MRKWNAMTEKKNAVQSGSSGSKIQEQPDGDYNAANPKALGKGGSRYEGGGYYQTDGTAPASQPQDGQDGKGYGAFGGYKPASDPDGNAPLSATQRKGQRGKSLREKDSENENGETPKQ